MSLNLLSMEEVHIWVAHWFIDCLEEVFEKEGENIDNIVLKSVDIVL